MPVIKGFQGGIMNKNFGRMENSKLIKYISSLSKVELTRFLQFINSPYFNQHTDVITLMEVLAEEFPDFKPERITREVLFEKVFQGEQFDYMKLAHVANYTVKLFESFLAIEKFNEDTYQTDLLLVKSLEGKNLDEDAERKIKKLEQKQNDQNADQLTYLNKYLTYTEKDKIFVKKQKREFDNSIQLRSGFLDKYYIAQKLKLTCDMLVRQNIFSTKYMFGPLDNIIGHVTDNIEDFADEPLILTYLEAYRMLHIEKGEESFYRLLKLLQQHSNSFSRDELITFYDFAQNFCIKMINSGNSNFLHEIFKIYKLLLKQNLVMEDQLIPAPVFKNMTTVGVRLKEYEWVENFIDQYGRFLKKELRNDVTKYNLATLYYSKKDYDKALIHLRDIDFTDVYYALGARSMLLKIYFEMKEQELLDSAIHSFKIYLRRNKLVSNYQYNVHYNLLRYTKKVFKLQYELNYSSKAKEKLEKLKMDIAQTKDITNKDWLLAQLQ